MSEIKENKMGVMPINRLLISMAVPMMISMLVQACYNVVDSMFVAQLNENALTAVSLAFPVQSLMIAVATGTGVGINALASRALGEKNHQKASAVANNGIIVIFLSMLVFVVLGLTASQLFFSVQTTDTQIIGYGRDYLMIVTGLSFGIFLEIAFERILQATGRTMYSMITQTVGAVFNIIFDPIMIFGLFGFPAMGVAGAALATVLGQILAAALGLYFCLNKNPEIKIDVVHTKLNGTIVRMIYGIGIPSIIMQSIGSIMTFGMNMILIAFSSTATAVFGVYFKLQSFVFMPVFGLNNGMVPIIGYNYGARKPNRIMETFKLSVIYATLLMAIGFAIFQLFPSQLFAIFNASDNMLSIGIPALRTISWSFLLAGFGIVDSSVFQALGHGVKSLIISVLRQLVVLLPCAFIFSQISLDAIWWAFPVAELFSGAASFLMFMREYKKEIKPMYHDNTDAIA